MSQKKDRSFRPKARRPRGFEDKPPSVVRAERRLVAAACAVYEAWGFAPLETAAFEYADALGTFLPDADRPNEGVFALQDDDDQWMALRYDLTAPLARFVAENFDRLPKPFRRYQHGSVWRNEKPGPGRFREFIQCDADSVGAPGPSADAEMIALASAIMEAAGLQSGEFLVRVNDRRLLDGVLEDIGVPATSEGALQRLRVLRAIDKLDRLGRDGVAALLGEGRKDESGDYTEGAGLAAKGAKAVLSFVGAGGAGRAATMNKLVKVVGKSEAGRDGLEALAAIDAQLSALGVGDEQAVFDPSIVRGLDYYTGPVFEAELLLKVTNEKGQPVRVGSIGGGGRYDDLVARFRGQPAPATGFSFGVSRFAAALRLAGRLDDPQGDRLCVVLALEPDRMADYLGLAQFLRAKAGVPAEVYQGGSGMRAQMKYADKRGARFAVMIGEDERKARRVTIKDLARGAEMAKDIGSHAEWVAARPAQETIKRSELARWIRAALAAPPGGGS
ncbi:MAG: histidine--tRNA ligase [Caulobacterales bacterium]|nr:histidine--tRNA ligase [Caulobacterales bacterium]